MWGMIYLIVSMITDLIVPVYIGFAVQEISDNNG